VFLTLVKKGGVYVKSMLNSFERISMIDLGSAP
jgi:hypothetical protein